MSRQVPFTFSALLLVGQTLLWGGQPRQIQLSWSELGPRIAEKKVALVLPDGTHVEGKVRTVQPDALHLRVSKTSDRKTLAKGERAIPRESVSLLRVTEYGTRGRLLTVAGTLGAAAGIVAAHDIDIYEGPAVVIVPAVVAGGMAGLGVASYCIGKRIDRRVTEIRIAPER